jgi:hypothetical protein
MVGTALPQEEISAAAFERLTDDVLPRIIPQVF